MSIETFKLFPLVSNSQLQQNNFQIRISCIDVCAKNLYIGTEEGRILHYFLDVEEGGQYLCLLQGVQMVVQRKEVKKIKGSTEVKKVISLVDQTLFTYNMLTFQPCMNIMKIKQVNYFSTNPHPFPPDPFCIQLCAGTKRKTILILKITEEEMVQLKEINIPDIPVTLGINNKEVCVALDGKFLMVNSSTNQLQSLFPFDQSQISKPIIVHIEQDEFLLTGPNALGIFSQSGGTSKRPPLQWTNQIQDVLFSRPYIVALSDEFITVHSILDQQQKQTIKFENGILIGEWEGLIIVSTNQDLFLLKPQPIESILDQLIINHRLQEALTLAKSSLNNHVSKQPQQKQQLVAKLQVKAGVNEMIQMNWYEAEVIFKEGKVHPFEIISLYPYLLPSDTNNTTTKTTTNTNSTTINTTNTITINTTTATTTTKDPLNNLPKSTILEMSDNEESKIVKYELFLFNYLNNQFIFNNAINTLPVTDAKLINTALLKLTSKLKPTNLLPLIYRSRNLYDVNSTSSFFQQYGCHHAAALALKNFSSYYSTNTETVAKGDETRKLMLKAITIWKELTEEKIKDKTFPGFPYLIDILSKSNDNDLIWKFSKFCFNFDQKISIKLFTPPEEKQRKLSSTSISSSAILNQNGGMQSDDVIDFLTKNNFRNGLIYYLEYLVYNKKVAIATYHTLLVNNYINILLSDNNINDQVTRDKLVKLLEESDLYGVQVVMARIRDSPLKRETAILFGKLEEHEKALEILVGDLKDLTLAEDYVQSNSRGRSQSYRTNLFHLLLHFYFRLTSVAMEDVVKLINKHEKEFDVAMVMEQLPSHWSIQSVELFLLAALREGMTNHRSQMIQQNLVQSQINSFSRQLVVAKSDSIIMSEEKRCAVCGKNFTDANFTHHPLLQLPTHSHCHLDNHPLPLPPPSLNPFINDNLVYN